MHSWSRHDKTFEDLGIPKWLNEATVRLNMKHPTDIQVKCVPAAIEGKSLIGSAKTGTGKTLAFGMPILTQLSRDPFGVFALVLTPVRELAFQIADQIKAVGESIRVETCVIVGGQDFMLQQKQVFKRPHIVIATPGRLADLLDSDPKLKHCFKNLRMLVMDEADRLLEDSFSAALGTIFDNIPKKRQMLLFSATITSSINALREKFGTDEMPLMDANPTGTSVHQLVQEYIFVPTTVHNTYLNFLLANDFKDESVIVFVPTVETCQVINTTLEGLGYKTCCLHSLQTQRVRLASLGKFRGRRADILIATDVASRGLDIPMVGVVINMGVPQSPETYVHRIGRTARAGRQGLALSIMGEKDVSRIQAVEKHISTELKERQISEDEVLKLLNKTSRAQQKAELLLSEVGFDDELAQFKARKQAKKDSARAENPESEKAAKKQRT